MYENVMQIATLMQYYVRAASAAKPQTPLKSEKPSGRKLQRACAAKQANSSCCVLPVEPF
jgi:hypothetical protein